MVFEDIFDLDSLISHHNSSKLNFRSSSGSPNSTTVMIQRASRLAEEGQVANALKILSSASIDNADIRNAKAVCMMRLERPHDAVNLYRSFLLAHGCTWIQPGCSVIHQTNFASSLILIGRPWGARDLLREIQNKSHPSVLKLQEILHNWERNLSWWQRFNWRCGIDPTMSVALTPPFGEFFDPLTLSPTTQPPKDVKDLVGLRAA